MKFEELKILFEKNWFSVTQDLTSLNNHIKSQTGRDKWMYEILYKSSKPFIQSWEFFTIEKDWQVADMVYGHLAGWSLRIRSIWGLWPWLVSRYEFNLQNHIKFIEILNDNWISLKFDYAMLKDKELIDYLIHNEDYLNSDKRIEEDTSLLYLDWMENLEDYYKILDQWQRRKFRLAEREINNNWYIVEYIDKSNSTEEEIKRIIEVSMKMNEKLFWERPSERSWMSMFRDMDWKTSPWKEAVFEMWLENQWCVVVKNKNWEIISTLFFYNDFENNYSLFINGWYDRDLSQRAFPIVWTQYIKYCLDRWIDRIEMMTYWADIYKHKFWAKSYWMSYSLINEF